MEIPRPHQSTVDLIYRAYSAGKAGIDVPDEADDPENAPEGGGTIPRYHLGASLIGHECARYIWLSWRWVQTAAFDGRMLRLLDDGKRLEAKCVQELRAIGVTVYDRDPQHPERQIEVRALGGHFGGSLDGVLTNVPEAPATPHVWECKSHSQKSFMELSKWGVQKAKPQHYAQFVVYMGLMQLTAAIYEAYNKNTSHGLTYRFHHDPETFALMMERAKGIIESKEPPGRVSLDPMAYPCSQCPMSGFCHGSRAPRVNCRTCAHATPAMEGDADWLCERHSQVIPKDFQMTGCEAHRFIPKLLENIAEPVDGNDRDNWMRYRMRNGALIVNGAPPDGYLSSEIAAAEGDYRALGDAGVDQMRAAFDGRIGAPE